MSRFLPPTTDLVGAYPSSDANRHGRPLKHARCVTLDGPLHLELGGALPEVTVVYETYGRLSPDGDNAVLVCHAISGDSHVARHDQEDDPGWWDIVVGPGKAIDTDRYFVICPNVLGGCRGTTGPNSVNPETGELYGTEFPVVTVGDMVAVQRRLIEALGLERLVAVVGGSLGGHMVLDWATRFRDYVAGAIALGTSARLTSQAVAFDVVGRNAILHDPAYQAGTYHENGSRPTVGLAIARMLGHITYVSRESMTRKFDAHRLDARDVHTQFETKFAVGAYLAYQGDRFVERFDANSYITLTMALDLFNLGDTPEVLNHVLAQSTCRWLIMSFSSDWLFPPFQSRELVDGLIACGKPVSYCNVQTDCGHDAFLLPNQLDVYGELMRAFLANLSAGRSVGHWVKHGEGGRCGTGHETGGKRLTGDAAGAAVQRQHRPAASVPTLPAPSLAPTSIFHHDRLDYDTIVNLLPAGASVLDLGCGRGGLLVRLRQRGHERIIGIEWDEQAILTCVRQGLDVVQTDLNLGLPGFADGQFDFVVLSQTLQAVMDVPRVLHDMLRVGRRGIVSFPNAAYHKHRAELAQHGRTPRFQAEHGFAWYNTPYVCSLSIADFEDFCHEQGVVIHQQIALNTAANTIVHDDPNLNADVAVVVISRR